MALLWCAESLTGWHPSIPAFLAVALMTVSPAKVVSWEEVLKIPWGSVFLFGASFSLVDPEKVYPAAAARVPWGGRGEKRATNRSSKNDNEAPRAARS
ncbi:MAG: hypothetical protein ACRDSJ_18910, partial [Rubrobacteraceae bacterium]